LTGDADTIWLDRSALKAEEARLLEEARKRIVQEGYAHSTQRLQAGDRTSVPTIHQSPFGLRIGSVYHYNPLPTRMASSAEDPTVLRWRIELHGLPNSGPAGLDIMGDVVLGRGADGDEAPDFDLDVFHALERGVSRRHALLRPSMTSLYLIDLQSTNGTRCNMAPVGLGRAFAIQNNDTVTLGSLTFQIKIIDAPTMPRN
jgi:hypothetical protein